MRWQLKKREICMINANMENSKFKILVQQKTYVPFVWKNAWQVKWNDPSKLWNEIFIFMVFEKKNAKLVSCMFVCKWWEWTNAKDMSAGEKQEICSPCVL